MPDIAEMDSYGRLCGDWGGAYLFTRVPPRHIPTRPNGKTTPSSLPPPTLDAQRDLTRADYLTRPVPREIAP
jgi:hypothetical protein